MKLVNNISRKNLGEGRSSRLGFTFCKRKDSETFETLYAISPCKDYLNDVVFSETTGKDCIAHGCHAKKTGAFDEGVFLAMKICLGHMNYKYANYEKDKQNLNNNILNILKFLNIFEEKFGIKGRSELVKVDNYEDVDKYDETPYIFLIPKDWVKATYAISLCSLLIRLGQWYDGEQDVEKYFDNFKDEDIYTLTPVRKVFKVFAEKGIPEQDMTKLTPGCSVHNFGIQSYVQREKI